MRLKIISIIALFSLSGCAGLSDAGHALGDGSYEWSKWGKNYVVYKIDRSNGRESYTYILDPLISFVIEDRNFYAKGILSKQSLALSGISGVEIGSACYLVMMDTESSFKCYTFNEIPEKLLLFFEESESCQFDRCFRNNYLNEQISNNSD